jgi:hypothetical protein
MKRTDPSANPALLPPGWKLKAADSKTSIEMVVVFAFRPTFSDFEVAASERRAHPVLDAALPVAGAAPATTIQEHEVQPGAIPKASLMEAALLSGDGSRLPVASRNRCRAHDLPYLSDNKCRGVRETDRCSGDTSLTWQFRVFCKFR